jgi:uncharacterized protein (DUF1330 family)
MNRNDHHRHVTPETESMSVYVIGHITIKDALKWASYRGQVPATLEPFGAELVFRGRRIEVFDGKHAHTDVVVIRFPDEEAARAWHESAAYQTLVPLRRQAAEVTLLAYDS